VIFVCSGAEQFSCDRDLSQICSRCRRADLSVNNASLNHLLMGFARINLVLRGACLLMREEKSSIACFDKITHIVRLMSDEPGT